MALEISRLGSPHSPPPMLGRLLGGCIFCRPLSRGSGNRHADNLWPPARPVELLGVLRAPGCATRRRGRVGAHPGGPPRPWRDLSRPRLSPHHVVLFHGRPPALTASTTASAVYSKPGVGGRGRLSPPSAPGGGVGIGGRRGRRIVEKCESGWRGVFLCRAGRKGKPRIVTSSSARAQPPESQHLPSLANSETENYKWREHVGSSSILAPEPQLNLYIFFLSSRAPLGGDVATGGGERGSELTFKLATPRLAAEKIWDVSCVMG